MFVSSNQLYYFCACITFGVFFGVFYSIFKVFFVKLQYKLVVFLDILMYLLFVILFTIFAYAMKFPSFRIYMPLGVLLGKFLYSISFEIILAKLVKKGYNILKRKKERISDERK